MLDRRDGYGNDDGAARFAAFQRRDTLIGLSVIAAVIFVVVITLSVSLSASTSDAGAWSTWSVWCYEMAPGVYKQTRRRYIDNGPSRDEVELRTCVTNSCAVWQYATIANLSCTYNASTNQCTSGAYTLTTRFYCSTNTTDWATYLAAQTPISIAVRTFEFPYCIPECPLTNATNTPTPVATPVPSPAPACVYTAWGDWSVMCLETSAGVYEQTRIRRTDQAHCTAQREYQPCGRAACVTSTLYQLEEVVCTYDTVTSECSTSSFDRRLTQICATNATNLTAYIAATGFTGVESQYLASSGTCDGACPRSGTPTAPSPSPATPSAVVVCANLTVIPPWSVSCDEVAVGVYRQWRYVSDPSNDPSCAVLSETRECDAHSCQVTGTNESYYICYYDGTGACIATGSAATITTAVCITNATNFTHYSASVTPTSVGFGNFTLVCLDVCPTTSTPSSQINIFLPLTQGLDLATYLTCTPPEHNDSVTETCELCESTDVCSRGFIDYELGVCVQIPKCVDNNPCTFDVCADDGTCAFLPVTQNALNTTLQQLCIPGNSQVTIEPLINQTISTLASCNDNNSNTIDGFDAITQMCTRTEIAPPVPPPNNSTTCDAPVIGTVTQTSFTLGTTNLWRCGPTGTTVCFDGECVDPVAAAGDRCDYQLTVIDAAGATTVALATDNARCNASAIPTKPFATCFPALCQHSTTACAYCAAPTVQGNATLFDPFSCACCTSDSECAGAYVCIGGQCVV